MFSFKDTLRAVEGKRVLVIGDLMLDRYWWGNVNRVSPEAPVPVVAMERQTHVLGGAANVAANVVGLGGNATLVGVTGRDEEAEIMLASLGELGIDSSGLVSETGRPTTVKTRILAHNQHVARIDREQSSPITDQTAETVLGNISRSIENADVVLLSDYNKGVLTDRVVAEVIAKAAGAEKKVIIDPKGRDFQKYRGAFILTPNQREAMDAAGIDSSDLSALTRAGEALINELGLGALLITRGDQGMLLLRREGVAHALAATAKDVYDVTGAGDTVIATLACGIAGGLSLEDAIAFANHAAGVVIEHLGTTAINRKMLGA